MTGNKTRTLIILIVIFLLGIFFGYNMKSIQSGDNPINLNPFPKSCQYNGRIYKSGESFPAEDGCNSCSCNNGNIGCTLMACNR